MSLSYQNPKSNTAKSTATQAHQTRSTSKSNSQALERLSASKGNSEGSHRPKGRFMLLGQSFSSLSDVHDWLQAEAKKPESTVPHEPLLKITLTPDSMIHQQQQTLWTYYSPGQKLILEGAGAVVSGLKEGHPTPGFFLAYRPNVGANTSAQSPAAANFEMRGVTVRGYESGGVEISPQAGEGEAHRWDGGISAFMQGAVLEHNHFEQLGSKNTKKGQANWSKQRYGVGGILARGLSGSQIKNNTFTGLENGDVAGTPTGQRLIHAVYLRDHSSNNEISGNHFKDVSGDPIRFSNASNKNHVAGNSLKNAGVHSLVSEFYNPTAGEADSTGYTIGKNDLGTLYGSSKKAKSHDESVSMAKRPSLA